MSRRRVMVYRCPTCRAVYDCYGRHPQVRPRPRWVRKTAYWGRLECLAPGPGCPACGYRGVLPRGTVLD